MKHMNYIYVVCLALALSLAGCNNTDDPGIGDDMQQIDGIALGLGAVETSAQATTRAVVEKITYVVNTADDPTYTHGNNFITARGSWKLDFHLFNGKNASSQVDGTQYDAGSFDAGVYSGGSWKPNSDKQLYFPNYFRPHVEAWLYPVTKDATVAVDQSDATKLLAQDQLYRPKNPALPTIAKKLTVELQHQRAMINFKFGDIVRSDIDQSTVKVVINGVTYTPYNVRATGALEFLLILPENTTPTTPSNIFVAYSTNGNDLQRPINYKHEVKITGAGTSGTLGSNNCYCFTLSGKALAISPVTIVNWTTGEPVSGEYVAVTAYPTFKGPANRTYYFYYDNKLTVDGTLNGTPKLQEINFNNDGECTIKPDGRIITHIFKTSDPSEQDWTTYKLASPIILGGGTTQKMYIDLTKVIK
ncbi:hypothetical protein [Limibacterium fermenti]|uniref:hypothetical protein n=1 Tax=Limibacterium fermenti TaxID=3229863 RepID=UPI003A73D786